MLRLRQRWGVAHQPEPRRRSAGAGKSQISWSHAFWLVGRLGLEPRTHGLKVRCSTIELTPLGAGLERRRRRRANGRHGCKAYLLALWGERATPGSGHPGHLVKIPTSWLASTASSSG